MTHLFYAYRSQLYVNLKTKGKSILNMTDKSDNFNILINTEVAISEGKKYKNIERQLT